MPFLTFLLLPVLLIIINSGCSTLKQEHQQIYSYAFEYSIPPLDKSPLKTTLKVDRFSISPEYNTDRIVYRDSPFSRKTYSYHRWHMNPSKMIPFYIARDFTQSGVFRGVFSQNSLQPADYSLSGIVNEFLEIDSEHSREASLSLTLTLIKREEPDPSRRILFQKTFSTKKPFSPQHPRALAESMSLAMAEISHQALEEIYTVLSEE